MKKQIDAHIYNPKAPSFFKQPKNSKAECCVVHCSMSEKCGLYARKECATIALLGSSRCPYGHRSFEVGPTQRARSFSGWISTRKEKYKDILNKLGGYKQKLAIVGDYIFLPYSHMNMNKNMPTESHGGFLSSGSHFVLLDQFTVDVAKNLIDFRPQAIFGGEITSYQKEVIPLFVEHLKEEIPDFFAKLIQKYPSVSRYITNVNYVGRNAFIHSLKPGTDIFQYLGHKTLPTQKWTWDGEFLTSDNAGFSFAPTTFSECRTRLKPTEDAIITITNNNQVDKNTKFQD